MTVCLIVKKSYDICEMEVKVFDGVLCISNVFFFFFGGFAELVGDGVFDAEVCELVLVLIDWLVTVIDWDLIFSVI